MAIGYREALGLFLAAIRVIALRFRLSAIGG
jgi:hypothetical protein